MEDQNNLSDNQAAFRPGRSTADHLFTMRSIVNRYLRLHKKNLYCCFVDFSRAFDSVWRDGLFYKLLKLDVSGKFYNVIKNMYSNYVTSVKLPQGVTDSFVTNTGIRQGDSLSPLLFCLFIDDIKNLFDQDDDPCSVGNLQLSHLLYADDLILISESQQGLRNSINKLSAYCNRWNLKINMAKTKILVFTPSGRIPKRLGTFKVGDGELEIVQSYKYLGVTIASNGSFGKGIQELVQKGRKAWYSLRSSVQIYLVNNPKLMLKLFDAMVKPIILYGAEVWSQEFYDVFNKCDHTEAKCDAVPYEMLHNQICKQILGLGKSTTNLGARVELGRSPLSIHVIKSTLDYWLKLQKSKDDSILKQCLTSEMELSEKNVKSWFSNVKLMQQRYMGADSSGPLACSKASTRMAVVALADTYSRQSLDALSKGRKDGQGSKLRTYAKLKHSVHMESYLLDNHISWKQKRTIAKFRLSDHRLRIEKGRHSRPRLPVEQRLCLLCNTHSVEDEAHFLIVGLCPLYSCLRVKYDINDIDQADSLTGFVKVMSANNHIAW